MGLSVLGSHVKHLHRLKNQHSSPTGSRGPCFRPLRLGCCLRIHFCTGRLTWTDTHHLPLVRHA